MLQNAKMAIAILAQGASLELEREREQPGDYCRLLVVNLLFTMQNRVKL